MKTNNLGYDRTSCKVRDHRYAHSHKKRKYSLETRAVLFIFTLELEVLGWPYRTYIKTAENGDLCEEYLGENDFETDLATFCCYGQGTKASEAVKKIATDQKEYRNALLVLLFAE